MNPLPRISIITPSLNQADFIEETILSVLDQDYPDLEFIVMDGGSTDATLEILQKYQHRLTWSSEADRGQSHAVNKGMRRATGEVLAFLNADDLLEPGALLAAGRYFADHPHAAWLTGKCTIIDPEGREIRKWITAYKNFWLRFHSYSVLQVLNDISQPATFWRRSVVEELGMLDEELTYTMDYEYWLRIGRAHKLHVLRRPLAFFRLHPASKSGSRFGQQFAEELTVCRRYASPFLVWLHRLHNALILAVYRMKLRQHSGDAA